MSSNEPSADHAPEADATAHRGGSGVISRVFWLSFLVLSLGYAGYSFYAPGNRVDWSESRAVAQRVSAETDKPIMLFFTGAWCSPCQIMKRQVFADDVVAAKINEGLIPVTIDVDDADVTDTLTQYQVGGTPRTIITDASGEILADHLGRMSKTEFLEMLGTLGPAAPGEPRP